VESNGRVVAAAVDELLETHRRRCSWNRRLQRSDVARLVAYAAVVPVRWDPRHGEVPAAGAPATAESRRRLIELVNQYWPDIDGLGRYAALVVSATLEALARLGTPAAPKAASEPACTRATTPYRAERTKGFVPVELDAADVASVVGLLARSSTRRLTKGEFANAVSELYDVEWQTRGAASLASHPPSAVGLGPDERPLLLPAPGLTGGWGVGTARSVYDRYLLHVKRTAQSRPSDKDPDPGQRRPAPVEDEDRPREEVRRTCSPYGLLATEHHGALVGIVHGLQVVGREPAVAGAVVGAAGPPPGDVVRRWHADRDTAIPPLGPDGPDAELVEAVGALVALWCNGRKNSAEHGDLERDLDVVERAVARKVWMELHRREREFIDPARRRDVTHAVRVALTCAVPQALRNPDIVRDVTADLLAREHFQRRLRRTSPLLLAYTSEVRGWRSMIRSGDDTWAERYAELVSATRQSPEQYLSADEVRDLLHDADGVDDD
jgi:hypothetical protein